LPRTSRQINPFNITLPDKKMLLEKELEALFIKAAIRKGGWQMPFFV